MQDESTPRPLCACGCGQPVNLYRGKANQYLRNHHGRRDPAERFAEKYRYSADSSYNGTSCWEWTARTTSDGYGGFTPETHKPVLAHRWSYEYYIGPIPEGREIDHLCRNRRCVNPLHLEPVSPRENWRRGLSFSAVNGAKTCCKRGHEFTDDNTVWYWQNGGRARHCRTCRKIRGIEKRRNQGKT